FLARVWHRYLDTAQSPSTRVLATSDPAPSALIWTEPLRLHRAADCRSRSERCEEFRAASVVLMDCWQSGRETDLPCRFATTPAGANGARRRPPVEIPATASAEGVGCTGTLPGRDRSQIPTHRQAGAVLEECRSCSR